MPKAVSDVSTTKRFDLKTAPPDGFVVLRKLSYGETLDLQKKGAKGVRESGQVVMQADMLAAAHFTFSRMIQDHNLTDNDGRKLDFNNIADMMSLDPAIGDEIDDYCTEMNATETDLGNLPVASPELSLQE